MNKELEQIALELRNCVQYCKEANGLPLCKNCGLDDSMISTALQRAYELGKKDENEAWCMNERCRTCGKKMEPHPYTDTCSDCWDNE